MPYLDKDAILNSLTKEDIIKICTEMGSQTYKENAQGELCFSTSICHGGDSPYKLVYYPSSELFKCFTCGDSYGIIELVIRASRLKRQNLTWFKALARIAQITGKSYEGTPDKPTQIINDFEWINRLNSIKKTTKNVPNLTEINENILEIFWYAPYQGWLDEHITCEALSRFEIGYYGLTNQITIPHRDMNGRLIGIRGRY